MQHQRYYYSTRDLLIMAAMAALGGLASTYINFIGDFFQSLLGFAGTTQWAAGLHVLWLILAVGLTRKRGAGTITGLLKGAVELFSGNTHGLLVVLVDITAGVLVDLSLIPFRKKDSWIAYAAAGGIASASNVFVFQLFAAVPADVLTYGVIGLIALLAFVSGVLFAGLLGQGLLTTLRSSGVVKDQAPDHLQESRLGTAVFLGLVLAGGLFTYLRFFQFSGGSLEILGAVEKPYTFSASSTDLEVQEARVDRGGAEVSYRGYALRDVLEPAVPEDGFDFILLTASDGYTFFISGEEYSRSDGLLLQTQGKGNNLVYNMVGPESMKAWVNGVIEIAVIKAEPLELSAAEESFSFHPSRWVGEMDSTSLDVGYGRKKYQGVPLALLFEEELTEKNFQDFLLISQTGEEFNLSAAEVSEDSGIRIFVILEQRGVFYAAAHLDGTVYLTDLKRVVLR